MITKVPRRLLVALAVLSVLIGAGGITALGTADGAPQWAVDFDRTLVQHLPNQVAPLLYWILGQGQYRDIHVVGGRPLPEPAEDGPPSWCRRPAIPARPGTLEHLTISSAALHGAQRELFVYLPPSYFQTGAACWRYPVVYLLDGWPGSAADWFTTGHAETTADRLIQKGTIEEVVLVSADGNGGLQREPQWANAYDGTEADETFLTQDVVGYVDHHFRTWADAQHRAIAGLSDGAFGAVNIGLHHPELFSAGLGLSGVYEADNGWPFGTNPAYRRAYSPLEFISDPPVTATARSQLWFLGAGLRDGRYYQQTRALDALLSRLDIPHSSRFWPGGHSWAAWGQILGDVLPWFDHQFLRPPAAYPQPALPPEIWPGAPSPSPTTRGATGLNADGASRTNSTSAMAAHLRTGAEAFVGRLD